ncbi:MAG: discoidin domain-containing protein [Lachnospiraceae bacterium]|nr:discoidin domain-containing protein [Lachnospiraceae bacterium]
MKKKVALLLAVMMLALTACQDKPAAETTAATTTPVATTQPPSTEGTTESATGETTTAPAVVVTPEKGVMQVFTQSAETLANNKALWENRELTTRQMEKLDRGLVAVKNDMGVFVSWRWLGDESNTVEYNLYRDGKKVNAFPLNVTNYTDTNGTAESTYQVAAVVDGVEQAKCEAVSVWEQGYYEIPLIEMPKSDNKRTEYEPTETSIADLDGDGVYEIVLKVEPTDRQDNANDGMTNPTYLDAYKLDGTHMWRINIGYNIRSGNHYTPIMVYDLDGDGKAEVVFKTADGTTDAAGTVIGDPDKKWRNGSGRVVDGPEYLTVFNGETGTIIDTIDYAVARGDISSWGDTYGNRGERYLACIAYLNGTTPSVVMCRGYYDRTTLAAYNYVDGKLELLWVFDTNDGHPEYKAQGNHSVAVADVDMDGKDEIVYGACVIDDDGTGLYSTGLGHGDAQHTGDLIPSRPGLEIFSVHEHTDAAFGMEMRDAMTGEILWGSYENKDIGRGVSADVDPAYPGNESWAAGKMVTSEGDIITTNPSISSNFRIYWDGDLGCEVQDGNTIADWVSEKKTTKLVFSHKDYQTNTGTKATPGITCDLIGDWREETILFKSDRSAMAIFISTEPTDYKVYTLMHDLQYRTYIATQNVGYNQPAHTGYYLGFDTTEIPVPRVTWNENGTAVVNPDLAAGTKAYDIETLMRDNTVVLQADYLNGIVNDYVKRTDAANNKVAAYMDSATAHIYVPLTFIETAFGVSVEYTGGVLKVDGKELKFDAGLQTKNGTTVCAPIDIIAQSLGKYVYADFTGFMYISDEEVEITEDIKKIYLNILENYVEPESLSMQTPVSGESLNEKQIPVYSVEASTDDGNLGPWAADGDIDTRWNGWDDGATLTLDLGKTMDVAAVAASFYKGNERNYYFDIEVSVDGENWTAVLKDQASPIALDKEELSMFAFPETVQARYVRYVGHNSSANNANNIWEIIVLAP